MYVSYQHAMFIVIVLTSKYIHCLCTNSIISMTSSIRDSVLSQWSTSASKALTYREAFIVNKVTWLSSSC